MKYVIYTTNAADPKVGELTNTLNEKGFEFIVEKDTERVEQMGFDINEPVLEVINDKYYSFNDAIEKLNK